MSETVPQSSSYWGYLSSAYVDLSSEQIFYLERAIRFQLLGLYRDAERAFEVFEDAELRSTSIIVAIERATLYERIGLERKRADILASAVDTSKSSPATEGANLYDLACILRTNAEYFAYGYVKQGLVQARDLVRRLASRDVGKYNDIESRCLLELQKLLRLCKGNSNWLDRLSEDTKANIQNLPTVGELRRSLQARSLEVIAQQLVKLEAYSSYYPDHQALRPYEEFFAMAEHMEDTQDEAILSKWAVTRIFYAEELGDSGKLYDAQIQLKLAERLLERSVAASNIAENVSPRILLLIARTRTSLAPENTITAQIESHKRLGDQARDLIDYPIQRVHHRKALDLAKALMDNPTPASDPALLLRSYLQLLTQYMDFELQTVRVGYFYIDALSNTGVEYVTRTRQGLGEWLRLARHCRELFPQFELPRFNFNLLNLAANIAQHLGQTVAAAQFTIEKNRWARECPGAIQSVGGLLDFVSLNDDHYIFEWRIDDNSTWCEHYMQCASRILLRIVGQELSEGLLSQAQSGRKLKWSFLATASAEVQRDALTEELVAPIRNAIFGHRDAQTGKTVPVAPTEWTTWMNDVQDWLLLPNRPPSTIQRQHLLYQIQRCRAQSLSDYSMTIPWNQRHHYVMLSVIERRECLRLERSLDPSVVNQNSIHLTELGIASGAVSIAALEFPAKAREETKQLLIEALEITARLETLHSGLGNLINLGRTLAVKARARLQLYTLFKYGNIQSALDALLQADENYRQLRLENALADPSQSFIAKRRVTEDLQMKAIYTMAVYVCVIVFIHDVDSDSRLSRLESNLFDWTQRSKGRVLTDLLGLIGNTPSRIMKPITQNSSAMRLLREEKSLAEKLSAASAIEQLSLRGELKQLTQRMRQQEPILRPLLDLREGVALSSQDFLAFHKELGENVIICEWIHSEYDVDNLADITLMIYKSGRMAVRQGLSVKLATANSWVQENLDRPAEILGGTPLRTQGQNALNQLQGLVEPILRHTSPANTLIFCPTGILHRIPLHAITVGRDLIIERNPVIYCQSLSILRLCHENQSQSFSSKKLKATVFNTMKNSSDQLDVVSQKLGTKTISRDAISKRVFQEHSKESSILHIHGHIGFGEEDPLTHHLVLREPPRGPDDKYTAREIFASSLHRPSLVMAMGCNGGRSKIFDTDDLLGLTAAFHYAGASSVVSSYWSTAERDTLRFTTAFYDHLVKDIEGGESSSVVNVALAFQHAVLNVRTDNSKKTKKILSPYSWASFFIHGSGLFPRL